MYAYPETFNRKECDDVFHENMQEIIKQHGGFGLLQWLRNRRALKYYLAVRVGELSILGVLVNDVVRVPQWLTGAALAGIMGLSGWTLVTTHQLSSEVAVLNERIKAVRDFEDLALANMNKKFDTQSARLSELETRVRQLEQWSTDVRRNTH